MPAGRGWRGTNGRAGAGADRLRVPYDAVVSDPRRRSATVARAICALVLAAFCGGRAARAQDPGQAKDLCYCLAHDERAAVGRLLAVGSGIDLDCGAGATPLHVAARLGFDAAVAALLERGAAVDVADVFGRTPLMEAVQSGHVDVARRLLAAGASAVRRDDSGVSPLGFAAAKEQFELIDVLLDEGADVRDLARFQPRVRSSRERRLTDQLIADPGRAWLFRSDLIFDELMAAFDRDDTGRASEILAKSGDRETLAGRVEVGDLEAVSFLLRAGADPDAGLALAAAWGRRTMCEALLHAGADPDGRGADTGEPLLRAIRAHRIDLVRSLLDWGSDPSVTVPGCGPRGVTTPLREARRMHDDAIVAVLLERGATE